MLNKCFLARYVYLLRGADLNGVEPQQKTHRSTLGGLITVTLYSLSFIYFIYGLMENYSKAPIPKVTSYKERTTFINYLAKSQVISIYLRNHSKGNNIDPFNPEQLILQPVLVLFRNHSSFNQTPIYFQRKSERYNNFQIDLKDLQFTFNSDLSSPIVNQDYFFALQKCHESDLFPGWKCASEQLINSFFNQSNTLVLNFNIEQYNTQTKKVEAIEKSNLMFIEQHTIQIVQTNIMLEESIVDSGFLFPSLQSHKYLNDFQAIQSTTSNSNTLRYYGRPTYLSISLKLTGLLLKTHIAYPKISEILASIGSIVTIILSLSILATKYNESKLKAKLQDRIIEAYYPDFSRIKFVRTWYGKITAIYLGQSELPRQQFLDYYENLQRTAVKKLRIENMARELAKVQLLLFSLLDNNGHNFDQCKVGLQLKDFVQGGQRVELSQVHHQQVQSELITIKAPKNQVGPQPCTYSINSIQNVQSEDQLKLSDTFFEFFLNKSKNNLSE